MRPDPTFDPGATLCGHANRIHYLGGGVFVCFECLLRHLPSPARPSHGKQGEARVVDQRVNVYAPRGRWAIYVGDGVLIRCRTKTEARRLWGQNHPDNPYIVRRVLHWRRDKEWVR